MILKYEINSFESDKEYFWRDREKMSALLAIFNKYGLLNGITYFGKNDKFTKIDSFDEIVEESEGWGSDLYSFVDDSKNPKIEIELYTAELAFNINFFIDLAVYQLNVADFIEPFNQVTKELVTLFSGVASFWPAGGVSLIGYKYPRVRPLRYTGTFAGANVVDYFSPQQLEVQGHPHVVNPDEIKNLIEKELPQGAKREVNEELIILQWFTEDWSDEELRRALSEREVWLHSNLTFDIDESYNEEGDYREFPAGSLPAAKDSSGFFTSYDSVGGVGFKAVVTTDDGDIDEPIKSEIMRLISQGALDDGGKLNSIKLITPSRERALKVYPMAKEMGIKAVYYTGKKGGLWNINPGGLWRE